MSRSRSPNGEIVSKHERWDEEWREVGQSHGWELPPPAPWPLRLWGIRYVRAAVASVQLIRQNQLWLSCKVPPLVMMTGLFMRLRGAGADGLIAGSKMNCSIVTASFACVAQRCAGIRRAAPPSAPITFLASKG